VTPPPAANAAPTISGEPATRVPAGAQYRLAPAASDADGDVLAFSIANRPAWARFSTATGELTGSPGTQHTGTYTDIRISVSDGRATAVLPSFAIAVTLPETEDGLTLTWDVPQQTASGAALGDSVTGYRIHYGSQADVLVESIEVPSAGTLSHKFDHLPAGTYYFAVRAITASGKQGELSNVVSGTIG
jgi:hypothetical protein